MTPPEPNAESLAEGTLISHLLELRTRLLRSLMVVGLVAMPCMIYGNDLFTWVSQPLRKVLPKGATMISTSVMAPLVTPFKLAFYVALIGAMPYVLYQAWAFVAPGLYKHEKRLVMPLVTASTLLFYCGAAFCYFFVFGQAFPAIQKMAPISVAVSPDIEAYLDFVITMFIAFGVAFEVPIVVVILARLGVGTLVQLRAWRTYFIVAAAAVSGLVTPPDPVSMVALLIPMCLLYEMGILAAQVFIRHTQAPPAEPSGETP